MQKNGHGNLHTLLSLMEVSKTLGGGVGGVRGQCPILDVHRASLPGFCVTLTCKWDLFLKKKWYLSAKLQERNCLASFFSILYSQIQGK